MAPKKKEQQKMSLGDFLTDSGFGGGSWADEVEETYVAGTQPLPPSDRPRYGNSSMSTWQDRGYSVRESEPPRFPDRPPFTAHLGSLSYDATNETVTEFFAGCSVVSVRIIEDRELQRPKGFGYVEFTDAEGLKKALTLDGESFQGRLIRIKVADPPRGGECGDSTRDLSDWTRKGPLPDVPSRGNRQAPDYGDRRSRDPALDTRPAREITWERRGPLSPLAHHDTAAGHRDGSRPRYVPEGLGERSESHRGSRQGAGTWGEGRQEGSRPPGRDIAERMPTAAEQDFQWRDRMRPDAPVKSNPPSQNGSEAPSSPSVPAAVPAPVGRPRLNLQKRTVSEATDAAAVPTGDAKASPFGAARPIDTATREKEIEEKGEQAIREKREADEKAKEERRVAKMTAAASTEVSAGKANTEGKSEEIEKAPTEQKHDSEASAKENGGTATPAVPIRNRDSREPREPRNARDVREPREFKDYSSNVKPRAAEVGSWRSAPHEPRVNRGAPTGPRGGRGGGPPRGPRNDNRGGARTNGSPGRQAHAEAKAEHTAAETDPALSAPEEDGWTKVPSNRKGRQGRSMAS